MEEYFELKVEEGYDFTFGKDSVEIMRLFRDNRGRGLGDKWRAFEVEIVSRNGAKNLKKGDFLIGIWGSAFVFRDTVKRAMSTMLETEGEILSFSSDKGEPLYLLVPTICDCLVASGNERPKDVPLNVPTKREVWCQFEEAKCTGRHVFMVPELWPRTFVSRSLVESISTSGFSGARFDSVTRGKISSTRLQR